MHDKKMRPAKERIIYIDLIRLFACFCIVTVHFNATVSGFDILGKFAYENSLIPNRYLGVYLGDIGVSLFFMISGASLMISNERTPIREFYKKRFLNIYPMFWIAYASVTVLSLFLGSRLPVLPRWKMILSILGYDGYLQALGLLHGSFYQIGEWFLGCMITLYLVWPLLKEGLNRSPAGIWSASLVFNILMYLLFKPGWVYQNWFFVRIPELLFGMTVVKYRLDRYPLRLLGALLLTAAVMFRLPGNPAGYYARIASMCAVLYVLLMLAGRLVKGQRLKNALAFASGLTYPVFLVHHWIISRIAKGIDLEHLTKIKTFGLYILYVAVTAAAAFLLKTVWTEVQKRLKGRSQR